MSETLSQLQSRYNLLLNFIDFLQRFLRDYSVYKALWMLCEEVTVLLFGNLQFSGEDDR